MNDGLILEGETTRQLRDSVLAQIANVRPEKLSPSQKASIAWINDERAFQVLADLSLKQDMASYRKMLGDLARVGRNPGIFVDLSDSEKRLIGMGDFIDEEKKLEQALWGEHMQDRNDIYQKLEKIKGLSKSEDGYDYEAERERLLERLGAMKGKDRQAIALVGARLSIIRRNYVDERRQIERRMKKIKDEHPDEYDVLDIRLARLTEILKDGNEAQMIETRIADIRGLDLTREEWMKITKKRALDEVRIMRRWFETNEKLAFGEEQVEGNGRVRLSNLLRNMDQNSIRFRALHNRLDFERALIEAEILVEHGEVPNRGVLSDARHAFRQVMQAMNDIHNPRLAVTYLNTFFGEGIKLLNDYSTFEDIPGADNENELQQRLAIIEQLHADVTHLETGKAPASSNAGGAGQNSN